MSCLVHYLEFSSNMNYENSIKKCRICLSESVELETNHIFEPILDGLSVADILNNISNIKVEKILNITNSVCKNCSKIIFDFQSLVKTYHDSERYFKTCLSLHTELIEKQEIIQEFENNPSDGFLFNHNGSDHNDSDNEESFLQDEISSNASNNGERCENKEYRTDVDVTARNGEKNASSATDVKVNNIQSDIEVPSIKYTCEICGDCFLFKSGFGHHMLMVHNVCIQVNQYEQFSSQITIKVPKGVSEGETRQVRKCNPPIPLYKTEVQCKKCKESFASINALKEHNEIHKTFRCDQCGAAFIKNSYLRDHLLKHSSDKCYSCKDCGQAFKYRSALAVHRREHVGSNTGHMCETCGRNFKERGTLKTHIMLKHTNERNFPCSGCDLTFKLKAARDKHYTRKHTFNRTKDFVCSMCGMAYLNKETLTRHMADKHTGTPSFHWCTVCHKSFTMKSNLSKHLRNKHNVIIKKE